MYHLGMYTIKAVWWISHIGMVRSHLLCPPNYDLECIKRSKYIKCSSIDILLTLLRSMDLNDEEQMFSE